MFEEVRTAVAALEAVARDVDPGRIDGHDAADLLELFGRGERVCAAAKVLLVRRVEETKVWRDGGYRSAAHWVAEATGETVGAACRTLETARALDALPETAAAFRAGSLSATQAAEITSAAGADPTAEAALLETASTTSFKGLRDQCRQVRAGAVEDDKAWAHRLHQQRRAHEWTDPDGAYHLAASMAPDAGARFSSAWNAQIDRIFHEARRAGVREPRAAYAADALVALAIDGPCEPVEVHLIASSAPIERGYIEPGERCEIKGIGPVPVTTARTLLNDARVTVMATEGEEITTVSSPNRNVPAKLRRALEARYPTCGVKSCADDRFLEIDHVVPVEERGETNVHNNWRICPHHHYLKTHKGWKVVGQPGNWDLVPPDDPDPP